MNKREPDAQNRENQIQSKGSGQRFHRDCKARSQPDWRGRQRDAGEQSCAATAAALDSSGPGCVRGTAALLGLGASSSHSNSAC